MPVSPVMIVLVGFVGALALITGAFLVQCGLARIPARRARLG